MNFFSICSNSGSEPRREARGGARVLERLDGQIDLAVVLDRHDLRLDAVPFAEMLPDVLHVVPVDLGDMDEPHPPVLELQERSVVLDPRHGARDGRTDLDLSDVVVPFRRSGPFPDDGQVCGSGPSPVNRGAGRSRSIVRWRSGPTTIPRPGWKRSCPCLLLDEARHNLHWVSRTRSSTTPRSTPPRTCGPWRTRAGSSAPHSRRPRTTSCLAQPAAEGANDVLAEAIGAAGIHLPGVIGGLPEADAFASAWCAGTDDTARRVMGQGIYALTEVRGVPAAAGTTADRHHPRRGAHRELDPGVRGRGRPRGAARGSSAAPAPTRDASSGPTKRASGCGRREGRSFRCPGSGVRPRTGSGSDRCTHRPSTAVAGTRRRWSQPSAVTNSPAVGASASSTPISRTRRPTRST